MFYVVIIVIFLFKFINFRRLSNLAKFFFNTGSVFFDYSLSTSYKTGISHSIAKSQVGFFSFNNSNISFVIYDNFYFYSYFQFFIFFSYYGSVVILSKKKAYIFNRPVIRFSLPTTDLAFNFNNKLLVVILFYKLFEEVAEWSKATVCKTVRKLVGSNPTLHNTIYHVVNFLEFF